MRVGPITTQAAHGVLPGATSSMSRADPKQVSPSGKSTFPSRPATADPDLARYTVARRMSYLGGGSARECLPVSA